MPESIPGEFRAWSALEPEIRNALEGEVERALARRSMPGALVYFLVTVMVGLSTSYFSDHRILLSLTACSVLLTGLVRISASRRLLAEGSARSSSIHRLFIASIYLTVAIWGAFCAVTIHLYMRDWTAMFVLLNTAALAAGASSWLAPSLTLALRCTVLMMAPTIVSSFLLRDSGYAAFGIMTSVYLGFLLTQARSNWWAFWSATVIAEKERIRGSADRLRAEAERVTLSTAIEQAAEEILITDTEANIRYCNPAFERVTGYSRGEVIGRNARFLKSGRHSDDHYRTMWTTLLEGRIWAGHFTNRRKDGSFYDTEGTIAPIHDPSGKVTGFVSAGHDVTERLRLESELREAQKMESIGRLAGGVAHDFNNLLTVISGYGGLLDQELPPYDPCRTYVRHIRTAGDRAAGLTRQLLAFSRKQIFSAVELDLNQFVGETEEMIQRLVGEDITVETQLSPEPALVSADPDQMSQILMNLAANARDAMPSGGRLTIRTASCPPSQTASHSDERPASILLAVTDTGVGIPEEYRKHLFEPFFTTKERGRGTGLGLSSVYGIVQQNKGWIDVQTEPGQGATFSIYLPSIARVSTIRPDPGPLKAAVKSRTSGTVLVVEDQQDVRKFIQTVLEAEGMTVLEADGGAAALAQSSLYSGTIHLLITDLIMPDMTGKQVAEQLGTLRPDMKVLFISGYSGDLLVRRGALEPNISYLPKPFTSGTLATRVRELLTPGALA